MVPSTLPSTAPMMVVLFELGLDFCADEVDVGMGGIDV